MRHFSTHQFTQVTFINPNPSTNDITGIHQVYECGLEE